MSRDLVQTITLGPTPPDPEIEIVFGNAHVGLYDVFLFDAAGANPQLIRKGSNIDNLVDKFPLPTPAGGFQSRVLSCQFLIQSAGSGAGQLYSVTVLIRQGGVVVPGGLLQEVGQMTTNAKSTVLFGRFA